MSKKTGPTNENLSALVRELKLLSYKEEAKIWKRVATDLEKPTRSRRIVNLSKISRFTKPDETIIVPGKVLGAGELNHKITVVAYNFSESAKEMIAKAEGKTMTISELIKINPKGKGIRIIG